MTRIPSCDDEARPEPKDFRQFVTCTSITCGLSRITCILSRITFCCRDRQTWLRQLSLGTAFLISRGVRHSAA